MYYTLNLLQTPGLSYILWCFCHVIKKHYVVKFIFYFIVSGILVIINKAFPYCKVKEQYTHVFFQYLYDFIFKIYIPYLFSFLMCMMWNMDLSFSIWLLSSPSIMYEKVNVYPSDWRCHLHHILNFNVYVDLILYFPFVSGNPEKCRSAWPRWHITKLSHDFMPLVYLSTHAIGLFIYSCVSTTLFNKLYRP